MSSRRSAPVIVTLLLTALLVGSGCGATDAASDATDAAKLASAGLSTADYLKEIQPQLAAYSAAVSTLSPGGPPSAAKTERLEAASTKLAAIEKELESITPSEEFADAHEELVASVGDTVKALDELAAASEAGDEAAYAQLVSGSFADSQERFAEAMAAATKPVQDAAAATN